MYKVVNCGFFFFRFFLPLTLQNFMLLQALFHHKHGTDDFESTGGSSSSNGRNKTKMAKIVVECRKEGVVNFLTPETFDQAGNYKWEKCRLALVKAVGGYMLEFYSPPKSQKVCFLFCFFLIKYMSESI